MPRVEVLTDVPGRDAETLLTERVPSEMLVNEHYADQLVERMGWALVDAEHREQAIDAEPSRTPRTSHGSAPRGPARTPAAPGR